MKKVTELDLGFTDAENYRRRENKNFLNQVFLRTDHLDRLCTPAISFLVGEKGTGKTAYSVFLTNNDYKQTFSSLKFLRETDYQKFVSLKKDKKLGLSDYTSIWKVIIYLLLAQQIFEREGGIEFFKRFTKLQEIKECIKDYYSDAFSPEITFALQFVQETSVSAKLLAQYLDVGVSEKELSKFTEERFQLNLFYIQKSFEEAFSQVRLKNNQILFIDGIDIRPHSIEYGDYLDCIKGLASAIWEVNNDFFPTIKGGGGRMRAVLLLRPDIFASLGFQNQNTKLRDNSVFLDWSTEYANY